jgi:sigma-B regulation protein RsbU (phosphoserine phosphatase)
VEVPDFERPEPAAGHSPNPFQDGTPEDRTAWAKLCNLQRRILPREAPPVRGFEQVLAYRPSFVVTGDYHDFFPRADGRTATFVGDGSGHGPAASMLMAIVRTLLHTHDVHRDPGEALTRTGRLFHGLVPSDLYMTGVYLLLGDGGRVRWASAGHHPPLWVDRTGRLAPIDLDPIGHVLGFDAKAEYTTVDWQVSPGDRLLLFTDGVWEARGPDGEAFGRRRLWEHFSSTVGLPLAEVVRELIVRVTLHQQGADFVDDFTVVGIERRRE